MNNNAQEIVTAGGGTLKDWAHLKKYEKENEQLKKINEPHRVVFMGNSITEGWSNFDKDFFIIITLLTEELVVKRLLKC